MNNIALLIKRYRKLKRTMKLQESWCTAENIKRLDELSKQLASLTPKWKFLR